MTTLMTILSQLSPNYLILAKQKSLEETVHRQYLPGFYPSVSQKKIVVFSRTRLASATEP